MPADFEDMDDAGRDPLWATFQDGGYLLEDDDVEIDVIEGPLVGALTEIKENAGVDENSRVYTIQTTEFDRPIMFWGSGHIDTQLDSVGVGVGHEIGVLFTGETRDTRNGEMRLFDVRYRK